MLSFVNTLSAENKKYLNSKPPRTIQEAMPLYRVYEDGIFEVRPGKFSKSWRFEDIDFVDISEEGQAEIIRSYEEFLSAFENDVVVKITINNRKINQAEFRETVLMPMEGDKYDSYRIDYNKMLEQRSQSSNGVTQDKYITVTVNRENIEDARIIFNRVAAEFESKFKALQSSIQELSSAERIEILRSFFHPEEEAIEGYDPMEDEKLGNSPKDYIVPDSLERDTKRGDHLRFGKIYSRGFYMKEVANYLNPAILSRITNINHSLMLSLDLVAVPPDEAFKEVEDKRTTVESNKIAYQKKQFENGNYTNVMPYAMQQEEKDTNEWSDDMSNRDQQMFIASLVMTVTADSVEQLDQITEQLQSTVRASRCQLGIAEKRQLECLNASLPWGVNDLFHWIKAMRTSEGIAAFMPFEVREICHDHGICYGQNKISKNLIVVDRQKLQNGNSFILGVSGAGKSFTGKNEVVSILLRDPSADVIVIDPEREYTKIARTFDGTLVHMSSTSDIHINALDINKDYSESADPVTEKSEFVMSLCEQIVGEGRLGPKAHSIIDRCTKKVYSEYQKNGYVGEPPTLVDLRNELELQPEKEAEDLSTALELFATGSLNTFAKKTNVDIDNRLIVYDIRDLGEQLMSIGMLVILDSILNRITANKERGKRTYIFIDEIYLLFKHEYSANFVYRLWKRVRKYNAMCTGITQDVADLLQNESAESMLSNSEFIIMLNQAPTNRIRLAQLLNISEDQQKHITNADVASGLIKIGSSIVPFTNRFPKNSLYALMHTDPQEKEEALAELTARYAYEKKELEEKNGNETEPDEYTGPDNFEEDFPDDPALDDTDIFDRGDSDPDDPADSQTEPGDEAGEREESLPDGDV